MDQEKIGKFIASCRKDAGYTQAALGEKLGITDRAISKWETGKSMPDASNMLILCEVLNITVNELLSGERISMENYHAMAEQNLLEFKEKEVLNNKKLLSLEIVIGGISTISFFVMLLIALELLDNTIWCVPLLVLGTVILLVGTLAAVKIEAEAGYYECPHCHEKHIPSFGAVMFSAHIFRARKLKCPHCHKKGYHKKVLTK